MAAVAARLVLAMFLLGILLGCLLVFPGSAEANLPHGTSFSEIPVATGPGDQVGPVVDGGTVWFNDLSQVGGRIMQHDLGGTGGAVTDAGVMAGPDADTGFFAWLKPDNSACRKVLAGGAEDCIVLPAAAEDMALAGDKAVTSHGRKVIRLVNFGTGRSKIIDSSTTVGDRYDPDMDGGSAVWVKERGYAGSYYEPLIVIYDVAADTSSYLTATGGGTSSTGESRFEREAPAISGGTVMYQQRIREPGEQWDIYRAVPETYGDPVVEQAGDQVNPAIDGNLLVYQDNRGGGLNAEGEWTGEWDLYLMDLATGVEMPLCTAAGDQVNPRIDGDVVVWQDNRSGDWDIYAASLAGLPSGPPEMTVRLEDALWLDYADYMERKLTVRYRFTNNGNGPAHGFEVRNVVTLPAEVSVLTLPAPVDVLASGQASVAEIQYQVPQGLMLFKTALFASCSDGSGSQIWFPRPPVAS